MQPCAAVQVQMLRHHNVSDVLEAEVHHELELVWPTSCASTKARWQDRHAQAAMNSRHSMPGCCWLVLAAGLLGHCHSTTDAWAVLELTCLKHA